MEIRARQRSTTMKRTVNVLSKLNWGTRACAVLVLCATTAIALPAQIATLTTIHRFCSQSGCPDGANPWAGLVQATNGGLYGTTYYGGTNSAGTIFKITPGGTLTTLYSFCPQTNCTDGFGPQAGLVQAANGDLYGTNGGGANSSGAGFKITPSGTLTTLYSFCSQGVYPYCTDGLNPDAGLVQAANGDLYGTTAGGGANSRGTVFKITPGGTLTTLHSFNYTDGEGPIAGLVQATNGDLYGTTGGGGAKGYGTVFKITPSGALTMVYSFCSQTNCADGANPWAGLVQAANEDLYGTTNSGGANGDYGFGTVFKITPSGTLTTLYSFCSQTNCTDGEGPGAGLVQAANGDFYGTTVRGGNTGYGTVFKNHSGWHADDAIQVLLPKRMHGRLLPPRWARPGHQWGLLRDNVWWRVQQRRHRIPPICRSGPVCENTAPLRQRGSGRQDSGNQSDRRGQRQL